ncbi:MAG: hypothetical protein HUJ80_04410, partial [Firmicutes bacterium]|nr:hypothetical protein [Bacillota bacterium]
MLFYRDLAIALLCMTAAPLGEKLWRRYLQKKRKEKLLEGFRDMLYTISSAVAAGRQLPFAVEEAAAALASSWGEGSDICKEAVHMASVYREAHGDPDGLWLDFARRSGIVEIRRFADSCRICRRNGGNMEEVCFKTASVLLERLAFQDDIKALSAEKRLEILILSAMPAGALVLLNLTSYEYIQVLYTTAAGRLLMT